VNGNRTRGPPAALKRAPIADSEGRQMKIHSATSAATGNRTQPLFALPRKENVLLAAGVTLAFVFVTACIFTLG
jgi:hypothetical protein